MPADGAGPPAASSSVASFGRSACALLPASKTAQERSRQAAPDTRAIGVGAGTSQPSADAAVASALRETAAPTRDLLLRPTLLDDLLALERAQERSERFAVVDRLVGALLTKSLAAQRYLEITDLGGSKSRASALRYRGLSDEQRRLLDDTWSLTTQQRQGAWFLPDAVTLRVERAEYPAVLAARANGDLLEGERPTIRAQLEATSDALFHWAALEPLLEALYLPLLLRGPKVGAYHGQTARLIWREATAAVTALAGDLGPALGRLGPDSAWSRLRVDEQRAAKLRYVHALQGRVATPSATQPLDGAIDSALLAARYRAGRLAALVRRYYRVAADGGQALSRRVLTRAHERTLAAYFGGSWLAFLDYLGEGPDPNEAIVTALPEAAPRLVTAARAALVAAELGLPPEAVAGVAATYWGAATSPLEARVDALNRYWGAIDYYHAELRTGMANLWGLVEDEPLLSTILRPLGWAAEAAVRQRPYSPQPEIHHPALYRRLLPQPLLAEIEELWGGALLPEIPWRIVSEADPHLRLAEAFGPALRFWHGAGLTAWFLMNGPYSRTDMAGLEHYHRRELAALVALGTPVDRSVFMELIAAESQVRGHSVPPPHTSTGQPIVLLGGLLKLQTTVSVPSAAPGHGFELLRDILTCHRRTWAQAHLATYLRARFETPLHATSRRFERLVARDGKPPPAQTLARLAAPLVAQWFGGDLAALYAALGEKAPIPANRASVRRTSRQLPRDLALFGRALFETLLQILRAAPDDTAVVRAPAAALALTELSVSYLQRWEALDRPPLLGEIGAARFDAHASLLAPTQEEAWARYGQVIVTVVHRSSGDGGHSVERP
jgi:hypothetical protein